MLVLLGQPWPWIVVGILLCCWGILNVQFNIAQWIKFLVNLIFNNFKDHTRQERRRLDSTTVEEAMTGNPGCAFILGGIASVMYGIIRWIN